MKAQSDGAGRSKPRNRRGRASPTGRSSQLTRDDITSAALEAADRGELELLTMRGLAEELGVTAMALYTHVENKDDILDQIIDRVLAREALPVRTKPKTGRPGPIATAERLRSVLTRYPALLDRYCRRPVGVPAALSRMEAAFAVLRSAGFDEQAVDRGVRDDPHVHARIRRARDRACDGSAGNSRPLRRSDHRGVAPLLAGVLRGPSRRRVSEPDPDEAGSCGVHHRRPVPPRAAHGPARPGCRAVSTRGSREAPPTDSPRRGGP